KLTAAVKGKQLAKAIKAKSPSAPSEVARTEAQHLKIVLNRSRHQTHISQLGGSGTDERTGKDIVDDEGDEGDESDEGEEDANEDKDGDERDDNEENQEVVNEDEGDGEEDQGLNIGEEERHDEEEEEDEFYRDVNINLGWGLQASLEIEDSHVVSRYQNTQQYGAMLPIELTNDENRNTKGYKEYYAFATGEAAHKPKASARRKMSGSEISITPPTVAVTPKLTAAVKGKQLAKAIKAKS
nr:hypothetical protein [Tanacetum cinerariifolium]